MSTAGSASGASAGADVGGRERRQVALHVDDDAGAALRVGAAQRLEDAVGAGGVVGARHHGAPPAGLFDGGRDRRRIGRDHDRPDVGLLRAPHHADDHRHAADIGQRLARQPRRGHAGRDQDQNVVVGHWMPSSPEQGCK